MAKLGIVKVRLDREVNGYILTCASTKEAVVVDPGVPGDKLAGQTKGMSVKYIVATHCHPGHVGGKDELKDLTRGQTPNHSARAKQVPPPADRPLLHGGRVEFGG